MLSKLKASMHGIASYKAPLIDWLLVIAVVLSVSMAGIMFLIIDSF